MSSSVLFEITTQMDKDDYRKFSYLTIFKRRYYTIFLIVLLAAVGALFAIFSIGQGSFDLIKFLLIWLGLIITEFAAIFLRVEYQSMKKMSMASVGLINRKQNLFFYENYLTAGNEKGKESHKIKYDKLFQILESKDYYLIYSNSSSASLIRKIDIHRSYQVDFQKFLQAKLGNRYQQI